MIEFPARYITELARFAAGDEGRWSLQGVAVIVAGGALTLAATDGHRMLLARPASALDGPVLAAPDEEWRATLLLEANRVLLAACSAPRGETAWVQGEVDEIGRGFVSVVWLADVRAPSRSTVPTRTILQQPLEERGRYPDLVRVIPRHGLASEGAAAVLPLMDNRHLADFLRIAPLRVIPGPEEGHGLLIHYPSRPDLLGVLMPMRHEGGPPEWYAEIVGAAAAEGDPPVKPGDDARGKEGRAA